MVFWILAAGLTAGILILVLRPLFVAGASSGIAPAEVYKAQLDEVEREAAAGLVPQDDAAAARAEIARRLLRAQGEERHENSPDFRAARPVALAVIGAVVISTLAIYLALGQPGLPGQPFGLRDVEAEAAQRLGPATQELERRLAEIEDPADRAILLGDVFASLGGIDEAEAAYLNAQSHRPGDPDILLRLAEVEIMRAQGLVTGGALALIEETLAIAPNHPPGNYYRALYDFQQGDYDAAEQRLAAMLAQAPPQADWTAQVADLLSQVRTTEGQAGAISDMTPEAREEMIRGMVQQLADRLEQAPDDFEGWLRLANAYGVLGEWEAAQQALSRARALAEGEPVLLRRVQAAEESLPRE